MTPTQVTFFDRAEKLTISWNFIKKYPQSSEWKLSYTFIAWQDEKEPLASMGYLVEGSANLVLQKGEFQSYEACLRRGDYAVGIYGLTIHHKDREVRIPATHLRQT